MSTTSRPDLPNPSTAPDLFEGLLSRRVVAYVIDLAIVTGLSLGVVLIGLVGGLLTFGISWLLIPVGILLVVLGYYSVTLGGPNRATIGMAMMDIVLTPTRAPLDGWAILLHPIIFWVTIWISWPVSLAIALFTPRRQMLHDLITGTLMVRRSPMMRHWATMRA